MKKIHIGMLISSVLIFSGCEAIVNTANKIQLGMTSGNYHVEVFSGGIRIKEYNLNNVLVSNEDNSDGFYWVDQGKLVRISGDIIVTEK